MAILPGAYSATGMPGGYEVYEDPNPGVKFVSSPAVSGSTDADRVVIGTSDGRLLAFPVL